MKCGGSAAAAAAGSVKRALKGRCSADRGSGRLCRQCTEILFTYTVFRSSLFPECPTTTVTPRARERRPRKTIKRRPRQARRRRQHAQTSLEFRPSGRGGAWPGAGRPRRRRSRVPHRSRAAIPGRCPVLVTLRVQGDVPPLRRERFVRAFRETLRQCRNRPGFRVAHYSIQESWHARTVAMMKAASS